MSVWWSMPSGNSQSAGPAARLEGPRSPRETLQPGPSGSNATVEKICVPAVRTGEFVDIEGTQMLSGPGTPRFACGVLLSLLSTAPACTGGSAAEKANTRPPPLVIVARVVARDVPVEVRAPVDLRPLEQADVGAKTLGYLDAVLVDRGDHIRRGQILALVRPSDLPDQLAAARGTLAQTQSQAAL